MRKIDFLIFLSIVLLVYFLVNSYIIHRAYSVTKYNQTLRTLSLTVLILLVLAYPVGRFLQNFIQNVFVDFILFVGAFYLGMMVYFFFLILVIDILRLVNSAIPIFPSFVSNNPAKTYLITFWLVVASTVAITVIGHINALYPRIRQLEIKLNKPANPLNQVTIVAMSDIHLGTIVRNSTLEHLVEKVNALNPDLILLPGDIVDEDVSSVMEQNMAASLQMLQAPYGVFAVTGNHEYFGGVKKSVDYIQQGNVRVLQDTAVKLGDAFYLIGRKDLTGKSFGDPRKPLNEILDGVDKNLPLILMDHQPFHLEDAELNGIDLQLSGHTHQGQLFPFNLITNRVYEKSWGYLRIGETQYYVSCGVGTWGPPIRIGNRPEILKITVRFE